MSKKWADTADPQMPAREFARTVLAERMEVVETLLPRARTITSRTSNTSTNCGWVAGAVARRCGRSHRS